MKEMYPIVFIVCVTVLGVLGIFRSCQVETARLACTAAIANGDSVGKWNDACRAEKGF